VGGESVAVDKVDQ
jgi:pre-rRNA-processing protein IPI3